MINVLDVSLDDHQQPSISDSQNSEITEIKCKRGKDKHNACSSKPIKVAKVKNKVSSDAVLSSMKLQLCATESGAGISLLSPTVSRYQPCFEFKR